MDKTDTNTMRGRGIGAAEAMPADKSGSRLNCDIGLEVDGSASSEALLTSGLADDFMRFLSTGAPWKTLIANVSTGVSETTDDDIADVVRNDKGRGLLGRCYAIIDKRENPWVGGECYSATVSIYVYPRISVDGRSRALPDDDLRTLSEALYEAGVATVDADSPDGLTSMEVNYVAIRNPSFVAVVESYDLLSIFVPEDAGSAEQLYDDIRQKLLRMLER